MAQFPVALRSGTLVISTMVLGGFPDKQNVESSPTGLVIRYVNKSIHRRPLTEGVHNEVRLMSQRLIIA